MFRNLLCNVVCGCLSLAAMVGLSTGANAAPVTVLNAGFELPLVNPANGLSPAGTPVDNWFSPDYLGGGQWDINAFPYASWSAPAPQGSQVIYVGAFRGPNYYEQTLTHNIQVNSTYELTGFVGNPLGFPSNFTADLRVGANVLASVTGAGPLGSFAPFSVQFDSTGSAFVGSPLTIRLFSDGTQACFDDIKLDVSAVPEPSTLLLAVGGLGGLIFRRKVRRRLTS